MKRSKRAESPPRSWYMALDATAAIPLVEVARRFHVSGSTVAKCVRRCRSGGPTAVQDRSWLGQRSPVPRAAGFGDADQALRCSKGMSLYAITWELSAAPSSVYALLPRAGPHRLACPPAAGSDSRPVSQRSTLVRSGPGEASAPTLNSPVLQCDHGVDGGELSNIFQIP